MRKKNNWVLARIGNALITAILAILVMATLTGFMIREGNWFMFSLPKHSLNGVTFRTELDVYSQDTENILVFLENNAEQSIAIRQPHLFLEKRSLGIWEQVGWNVQPLFWDAFLSPLDSGGIREYNILIREYADSLSEGQFRVLVLYESGGKYEGGGKTYAGKAEFVVSGG